MRPFVSFLRILIVIAVVDLLVVFGLARLELSGTLQAGLGALLVAGLTAPFLYFWVVKDMARHLSELSSARASRLKFRALMDTVAEAAVFVDAEGRIRHVNRQTERIFGFERTELINQPIEMLVPKRFREAHVGFRDRYIADPHPIPQGIGRELVGLRRDGSEFPMELSLSPVEADSEVAVLALVTDISRRRHMEAAAAEELKEPVGS
jgi:PAS domain S-box-containing protein